MILQFADFLLHRAVDEVKVSHELAVAGLINNTLEEAADETGVFGHRVRLFGAFTKLSGQGYGHWKSSDNLWQNPISSGPFDEQSRCEGLRRCIGRF